MHMSTLKRQWTTDDLRDLPDDGNRYEVIDGELFVTPAPSWKHQRAAAELFRLVAEYLAREPYADVLIAPADVSFSRTRSVQPDLFVVPLVNGQRPNRFEDVGRLLLAVEILSPSTARADRVSKRVLFRDEGVSEYWVVDLVRGRSSGRPQRTRASTSLSTGSSGPSTAQAVRWWSTCRSISRAYSIDDRVAREIRRSSLQWTRSLASLGMTAGFARDDSLPRHDSLSFPRPRSDTKRLQRPRRVDELGELCAIPINVACDPIARQ